MKCRVKKWNWVVSLMFAALLAALGACGGTDTSGLGDGAACGSDGQACCGGTACNGGLSCGTDARCHAAPSATICPAGLQICQGQAPLRCEGGTRWVNLRAEGACPQGTTCLNGDCRPTCGHAGERRCLDGRDYQTCGQDGAWNPTQSCPQPEPYCNMVTNTCTAVPGTCTSSQAGSLRCSDTGGVERCELAGGRYDFVRTDVNCFAAGYAGGCVPLPWSGGLPSPRPLMACRNTCGGQPGPTDDCRLAHEPGTAGNLLCANYVCERPAWAAPTARDRCATYEDRQDCRGPGSACTLNGQCSSGHCGTDRLCD